MTEKLKQYNQKQKPVTLSSLAKELNLHVTTVSRVLNGNSIDANKAAAPETVNRIRKLAKLRNYRPNLHAIGLRTKKSKSIAVLVPRLSDLVVATIYEGIDAAASDNGYLSFVSNTEDSPKKQHDLGEMALSRGADGIIFADARTDNMKFIRMLKSKGIPVVLVSRRARGFCSVTCNDIIGGALAAEHLINLGHKKFAVIAGEKYASTGRDRTNGFLTTCAKHNINIPASNIFHGSFHTHTGREVGDYIFNQKEKPTAIFAVNDFLAIGLMGAARDHNLIPGKDIAIIGYNDTSLAAELPISLTSIKSPRHQMGYKGLELLLQQIEGKDPKPILLAPRLIIRDSCGGKASG